MGLKFWNVVLRSGQSAYPNLYHSLANLDVSSLYLSIGICALDANKLKDAPNGKPLYAAFVFFEDKSASSPYLLCASSYQKKSAFDARHGQQQRAEQVQGGSAKGCEVALMLQHGDDFG